MGQPLSRRVSGAWPALVGGLLPVLFIPISVDAYILPRVLVLLGGGAAGLWLLLLGRRGGPAGSLGSLALPCLAVVLAALLALVASVNRWTSLAGAYLRYESFPVRTGYVLLFCVAVWLLDGERDRRRALTWFLLGCGVCSLEAVWEWYAYERGLAFGLARPDGNLGNAGLLGGLLAMAVPIALWRALDGGVRRPAWLLLLLVLAAGLLVSTERAGWLAALVACGVVVLAWVPRRWRAVASAAAICALLAGGAVVAGPLGELHSDPLVVRLKLWSLVLPMVQARPLLGWGEDTFGLVFGPYSHGYLTGVVFDRAHSQVLDLAVAQGLVGVAAAVWFWVALAWGLRGRWRLEEAPALVGALLGYGLWAVVNFDWVPVTGPAWLLAGVLWSVGPRRASSPDGRAGLARPLRSTVGALATVAAIAFGVLPVLADSAYFRGDLRLAVRLDPIQARYHSALADQLEAEGDSEGAGVERRRASELGSQP